MNSAYGGATRGRQQGIALVHQVRRQRQAEEEALRRERQQQDEARQARERFEIDKKRQAAEERRANEHLGIAKAQAQRSEKLDQENKARWEAEQKTGVEKTAEDKRRWETEEKRRGAAEERAGAGADLERGIKKTEAEAKAFELEQKKADAAKREAALKSPGHDLIAGIITGDESWRDRHPEIANAEVLPDNSIVITGKDGKTAKVPTQTVLYHMDLEGYQPSAAGINAGIRYNQPSKAEVAQQGAEALQELNDYYSLDKVPAMKLKGIQHDLVAGMPFSEAARKWKLKDVDPERAAKAEELAAKKEKRAALARGEGVTLNRGGKIVRLAKEIKTLEAELQAGDPTGVRYSGLETADADVGPQSPAGQGIAPSVPRAEPADSKGFWGPASADPLAPPAPAAVQPAAAPVQPPTVAPGVQQAQARLGPVSDRDLDKDGVVSDLEDQYHRAKRATQLAKDPATRAKIAAQKGEAWLVAQEALVQRIESQIKSGVKLYVDDVMGETPKAGSK